MLIEPVHLMPKYKVVLFRRKSLFDTRASQFQRPNVGFRKSSSVHLFRNKDPSRQANFSTNFNCSKHTWFLCEARVSGGGQWSECTVQKDLEKMCCSGSSSLKTIDWRRSVGFGHWKYCLSFPLKLYWLGSLVDK